MLFFFFAFLTNQKWAFLIFSWSCLKLTDNPFLNITKFTSISKMHIILSF